MNTTSKKKEIMEGLFKQLDKGSLPPAFRTNVMNQVFAEAERAGKKKERIGLAAVSAASLLLIGLAVFAFIYTDTLLPKITIPEQPLTVFYLFITILVAILLLADYKFRVFFKRKYQKSETE